MVGANTIMVVRVGSGGTPASVTLKDNKEADVVTLTTLYPTSRALTVTIKESLEDETQKLAIIQEGTKELEAVAFTAGATEVAGIVAAFADSVYVKAVKKADGSGTLKNISQSKFSGRHRSYSEHRGIQRRFSRRVRKKLGMALLLTRMIRQCIRFFTHSSTESLKKECTRMLALAS